MTVARVAQQPAVKSQFPSLQGEEGEASTVSPGSRKPCPHPGSRYGHPQHGPEILAKMASLRHQQGWPVVLPQRQLPSWWLLYTSKASLKHNSVWLWAQEEPTEVIPKFTTMHHLLLSLYLRLAATSLKRATERSQLMTSSFTWSKDTFWDRLASLTDVSHDPSASLTHCEFRHQSTALASVQQHGKNKH